MFSIFFFKNDYFIIDYVRQNIFHLHEACVTRLKKSAVISAKIQLLCNCDNNALNKDNLAAELNYKFTKNLSISTLEIESKSENFDDHENAFFSYLKQNKIKHPKNLFLRH